MMIRGKLRIVTTEAGWRIDITDGDKHTWAGNVITTMNGKPVNGYLAVSGRIDVITDCFDTIGNAIDYLIETATGRD